MIKFDKSKVICIINAEQAEIGKKYVCSSYIGYLKDYVENGNCDHVYTLESIQDIKREKSPFIDTEGSEWEYIYPYEEPPEQRMTNRQFMEWLAKRNGIFKHENNNICYIGKVCAEKELNDEVDEDIVIRTWDSEEWVEPTYEIYLRDCKGGKE